jgi:serpin B
MGMKDAFIANKADFKGMVAQGPSPYVSAVIHKTFVDVNEQGTEAAAVTAMMMAGSAMPKPETPFEMKVDRPFFFAIANRESGAIVFMGIVNDPANNG